METDRTHGQAYEGLSLSGVPTHPAYVEEPFVEGEKEHHEKKPVLKKVKEKVKKIKDTLGKKTHGHGDDHNHGRKVDEEDEGYEEEDDEREANPEVHGAPMHETARANSLVTGEEKHPGREEVRLGDVKERLEEDPAAPLSRTGGHQNRPSRTGGEEVGMSPILHSFQAMRVTDQPPAQEKKEGEQAPRTGSHDQFAPKPVSEGKPAETTGEPPKQKEQSYTEKISSATIAAKDAAASAAVGSAEYGKKIASTVYEKVAEAGMAIKEKVKPGGSTEQEGGQAVHPDKGVSVREFLAEKLRPGDEDRALCEVISDVIHKREPEEEEAEKGVEEATGPAGAITGATRVAEKIRGAVTSLFGASSRAPQSPEANPKGTEAVGGSRQQERVEKLQQEDVN